MTTIVSIIQTIALCYQCGCCGIVLYGRNNEGSVSEDDIQKFIRRNWICCAIVLSANLLTLI